jgi:hypothetical protein
MSKWLTFEQVLKEYEGVITERLLRRAVAQRRVAFSKPANRLLFTEADIETFLSANRVEAVRRKVGTGSTR